MNSCLYEGWVRHRRLGPVVHEFRKQLFLVYLDLAELDEVFRGRWLWSTQRPAFVRFRREDHFGDVSLPLDQAVHQLLQQADCDSPGGPLRLLTGLRSAGYAFNPLSLFYCFDVDEQLQAVVAEVSNTPWGERHCYVLEPEPASARNLQAESAKEFHVSPFMPMDVQYRWQLTVPAESLTVSLANWRDGEEFFDVTMQLRRQSISTGTLARALIRYPLMSQQVIASIYWQAFRLWRKRCPFYPHPQRAVAAERESVQSR